MRTGLLFAFDDGFVDPGLVAMTTAVAHLSSPMPVFVLAVDVTPTSVGRIHASLGGHDVHVLEVGERLRGLPVPTGRLSLASWARLLAGSALPEDVERIVYLDADLLVRGSIDELVSVDLGSAIVCACPDYWGQFHAQRDPVFGSISSAPPAGGYFNSGVMVVDLAAWRAEAVEERAFAAVDRAAGELVNADQDALNAVLWDRWTPLDWLRWNYPGTRVGPLTGNAAIVHFFGEHKPWLRASPVAAFQREYEAAAATIGWDVSPVRPDRLRSALRWLTPTGLLARMQARRRVADGPPGSIGD